MYLLSFFSYILNLMLGQILREAKTLQLRIPVSIANTQNLFELIYVPSEAMDIIWEYS